MNIKILLYRFNSFYFLYFIMKNKYIYSFFLQRYQYRFTNIATIGYLHMLQFPINRYSITSISICNDTSILLVLLQRYKKEAHHMGRPLYESSLVCRCNGSFEGFCNELFDGFGLINLCNFFICFIVFILFTSCQDHSSQWLIFWF